MKGVIYKIINTKNNKFYLGSTVDPSRRWKTHLSKLRKNSHYNIYLQRAFNKYKEESFIFQVLYESKDIKKDEQLELNNLDYSFSYNISRTSTGGDIIKNHPNKKEIYSKRANRNSFNRVQICINGIIYESYSEAEKLLSIPLSTIRSRCLSYSIKYKDWNRVNSPLKKFKIRGAVKVVCENTLYLSYSEAAKAYNTTVGFIWRRVNSKNFPDFYLLEDVETSRKTYTQASGNGGHP